MFRMSCSANVDQQTESQVAFSGLDEGDRAADALIHGLDLTLPQGFEIEN